MPDQMRARTRTEKRRGTFIDGNRAMIWTAPAAEERTTGKGRAHVFLRKAVAMQMQIQAGRLGPVASAAPAPERHCPQGLPAMRLACMLQCPTTAAPPAQ
jgi:hypothetical protein